MATSLYLFLMYLIPVVVGMVTLSASAYGLGKHENNTQSVEYNVSLVFFIIGLLISTITLTLWVSGNYSANKYAPLVVSKQRVAEISDKTIDELAQCKEKLLQMETSNKKKILEDLST